jgi:hypothetical protein
VSEDRQAVKGLQQIRADGEAVFVSICLNRDDWQRLGGDIPDPILRAKVEHAYQALIRHAREAWG